MFVLIVGCGRVGSAVAKSMLSEGHEVSVLDEDSGAIALLNRGQPGSWEDLGGSFTVGTALEVDRVVVRVLDPARARWYSEQGLQTVCPTQTAIELLEAAVRGHIRFEGVSG